MRRFLAFAILLLALGGIPATAQPACTVLGTQRSDVLSGTSGADVICGLAGNDYENGQGGDDRVRGGRGGDTLVGGSGQDRILGKKGNDRLLGSDGQPLDRLAGGPGSDTCHVDIGDSVTRCEHIDVARPLLTQNLMVVPFSPALVQWLEEHS